MSRTVKTLVAFSLLLNLLLAGFIIGHAGRSMMAARVHDSIEQTAESLPADKREQFRTVMHRSARDAEPLFRQLDASRDKATNLLKAEPFDAKAFTAQTEEMEKLHAKLKQRLSKAIVEAAASLNPEERVRVAEIMRRPPASPGECEKAAKEAAAKR